MWYFWRSDVRFNGEWNPSPFVSFVEAGSQGEAMEKLRKISYGWNDEYQRLSLFCTLSKGFSSLKEAQAASQQEYKKIIFRSAVSA